MAVTLGSIAAALLGFAGVAQRGEGPGHKARPAPSALLLAAHGPHPCSRSHSLLGCVATL
jgi:hypothetical protein